MLRLFEKMQTYQFDQIGLDESTLDASVRALTEEDLNRYVQWTQLVTTFCERISHIFSVTS